MKINDYILSIPPYISTSWKNVSSLHVEDNRGRLILVVSLMTGERIEIPDLQGVEIESVFNSHARFLEQEESASSTRTLPQFKRSEESSDLSGFPFRIQLGNLENLGTILQHNSEQSDAADLPEEMLNRIASIAKTVGVDADLLPQPEPHCNCHHCQIARAIQKPIHNETEDVAGEEPISDEDLKFRNWDIQQTAERLFIVTNPLDQQEHYNVYLGDPVGCTCGDKNCEHIQAVLRS